MCSFRSCQTRFEFLSQFRKVRNAFECFITQVQTRLPKTKCVWPMKINVICTVSRVYLYMIKSFRVHCTNFLGLHVTLLPTTLVIWYPRMEWPSSRMGWPYNYIGRILIMLAMFSRIDAQAYQKHSVLDPGWPSSICLEEIWKLVGRPVRLEFRWW